MSTSAEIPLVRQRKMAGVSGKASSHSSESKDSNESSDSTYSPNKKTKKKIKKKAKIKKKTNKKETNKKKDADKNEEENNVLDSDGAPKSKRFKQGYRNDEQLEEEGNASMSDGNQKEKDKEKDNNEQAFIPANQLSEFIANVANATYVKTEVFEPEETLVSKKASRTCLNDVVAGVRDSTFSDVSKQEKQRNKEKDKKKINEQVSILQSEPSLPSNQPYPANKLSDAIANVKTEVFEAEETLVSKKASQIFLDPDESEVAGSAIFSGANEKDKENNKYKEKEKTNEQASIPESRPSLPPNQLHQTTPNELSDAIPSAADINRPSNSETADLERAHDLIEQMNEEIHRREQEFHRQQEDIYFYRSEYYAMCKKHKEVPKKKPEN